MKSEEEIRQKLIYYEGVLTGMEAGRMIGNPSIFLQMSQHFPKEAMEMLETAASLDEMLRGLPTEDQPWIRQWLESLATFARQVLETRIGLLRWILEKESEAGGVTHGDGI